MECGEIDLASILQKQQGKPISMNFIRMYWEQVSQSVDMMVADRILAGY
jgi:serine/threonine-protein kinase TTK/MPS1